MKIIPLMTCNDNVEAKLIQGHLQNEGIPCFLTNQNYTNLYPGMSGSMGTGIQIQVNEEDAERASDIIRKTYPESYGNLKEKVSCPNCKSENIKISFGKHKYLKYLYFFVSLLTFIPMSKVETSYICKDCKKEF